MIIEEGTDLGKRALIICKVTGRAFSKVKWFNTLTKEAEIYVTLPLNHMFDIPLWEKLNDKYNFYITNFDPSRRMEKLATYDVNKKKGSLIDGAYRKQVTALVTLDTAIAIDRVTLEELKENTFVLPNPFDEDFFFTGKNNGPFWTCNKEGAKKYKDIHAALKDYKRIFHRAYSNKDSL